MRVIHNTERFFSPAPKSTRVIGELLDQILFGAGLRKEDLYVRIFWRVT
jgi:hypothetical protein